MSQHLHTYSPRTRIVNIPGKHDILYYIGRHLPLWEWIPAPREQDDGKDVNGHYIFNPSTVATCLQVCRYWQKTLTPVLWHTYTAQAFQHAPFTLVQRNSKFLKAIETDQAHRGPFEATELADLFLTPQRYSSAERPGLDLREQMVLLRNNRDLKALYWLGDDPRVMLDDKGLVMQRQLVQVILLKWDGGDGRLVTVLRAIAGTIKRLGLFMFNNVHEGDLLLPPSKSSTKTASKPTGQKHDDGREGAVMLPEVDMLTFQLIPNRCMGLIDLLRCCPKLTELSVNCGADDISRLIFNIQHYTPNLKKLSIAESIHHPPETMEALLRACRRGRSLEKLAIKINELTEGVTSAIVAHAGRLESLEFTVASPKPLNLEFLMRILAKCTKVKSFMCTINSEVTTHQSVLKALASQPWGGSGLNRFGIHVNSPGNWAMSGAGLDASPGRKLDRLEDYEGKDKVEFARDMAELKEITGTKAAMGWRVFNEPQGGVLITHHERRMLRELFCLVADKDKLTMIQWSGFTFKKANPVTH
ncbi:hypothetical protein BGW39_010961 [Mortierella sp. 14UC]|nr:hypothetical protein BGW39_010961 [Mortierella sp. 14UC]